MGTVNFKGKAARVPLKENFGRNFFVKKFFKLRKTVKKANVLICRYMKFYAVMSRQQYTCIRVYMTKFHLQNTFCMLQSHHDLAREPDRDFCRAFFVLKVF